MFKKSRGSAADYTAISYTWHAQLGMEEYDSAFCNGKAIKITRNLADLLYRVRGKYDKELWIDQLCINQTDEKEKAQQILYMQQIYPQAREVVFWIGEEVAHTPAAFELIKKLDELFLQVNPGNPEFPAPGAIELDDYMTGMSLPTLGSGEWWPLIELLQRPVFERLWIVQEVVLGSRVNVQCGQYTMSFETLGHAALYLHASRWIVKLQEHYILSHYERYFPLASAIQYEHDCIEDIGRVDFLGNLYNRRENFQDGSRESFVQLLLSTRRCKTSIRRHDKVYALLGLLAATIPNGQIPSILHPHYEKTAEEVFRNTTRYLIEHESLEILSGVEDTSLRPVDLALPSWVPNFDVFQLATILGMPSHSKLTPFSASGLKNTQKAPCVNFEEPDVLQIEACKVDNVLLIGPEYGSTSPSDVTFLEGSARLVDLFQPYPTGEHIVDAFWRTLVGNNDMISQYPADETMLRNFVGFCLQAAARLRLEHEQNKLAEEGITPTTEGVDFQSRLQERLMTFGGDHKGFILSVATEKEVIPFAPFAMDDYARGLFNVFTIGLLGSGRIPASYLKNSNGSRYRAALRYWCFFRRCFTTRNRGYIGIGPRSVQQGDEVFVLKGGRVPFVLRKGESDEYRIVGECYVHGIMHGEALPSLQRKEFEWIRIR